ncbi:hypothetical protein JMM81_01415 [Bacillus sp. V3B]|uniref:hypothetical protein n=1 Tax=Bacillus sp. V3B TaxID=2804915 RepID=UPI002108A7DE|nr:hypothetical protein [Bacillus sp. V3B]MCQ6273634.1 hypothetical protein [Bacillus sp. V3B]
MGFEFFFDNPFILIILIAVLSSLFKKRKGKTESKERTYHPKENKQTKPISSFDEVKEIFKEVTRSFSEETTSSDRKIEKPIVHQKTEELYQQMATDKQLKSVEPQSLPIQEKPESKEIDLDQTKLVDAVIWSEILGPPRAKKPYMKSRYRN